MENGVFNRRLQLVSARYSFFWMAAANLVGLWMAALLIWPQAGEWMGSIGYGRWMPLHMDWHLYGWCSLPLVGLLFYYFFCPGRSSLRHAHAGFLAWSAALLLVGLMCLAGRTSGKLFLAWSGPSRVLFPAVQVFLWALLTGHAVRRWRAEGLHRGLVLKLLVLLVLASSPVALFITSGRSVYPPIDPESGGATGHSLLASTLGIIGLFGLLPKLVRVRQRSSAGIAVRLYIAAYTLSVIGWALLDHGNASNTQVGQELGLGILLLWIPLVAFYYLSFDWGRSLRAWVLAFLLWWLFLTATGFIAFLPPVLTVMKFTNGLVAHAHLAMAGMITCFNMIVLASLDERAEDSPWHDAGSFWLWQTGCLVYVVIMLIQGFREGMDPFVLYGENTITNLAYAVRFLAGAMMLVASIRWLALSFKNESN